MVVKCIKRINELMVTTPITTNDDDSNDQKSHNLDKILAKEESVYFFLNRFAGQSFFSLPETNNNKFGIQFPLFKITPKFQPTTKILSPTTAVIIIIININIIIIIITITNVITIITTINFSSNK